MRSINALVRHQAPCAWRDSILAFPRYVLVANSLSCGKEFLSQAHIIRFGTT
jgi:hypothetical protein